MNKEVGIGYPVEDERAWKDLIAQVAGKELRAVDSSYSAAILARATRSRATTEQQFLGEGRNLWRSLHAELEPALDGHRFVESRLEERLGLEHVQRDDLTRQALVDTGRLITRMQEDTGLSHIPPEYKTRVFPRIRAMQIARGLASTPSDRPMPKQG